MKDRLQFHISIFIVMLFGPNFISYISSVWLPKGTSLCGKCIFAVCQYWCVLAVGERKKQQNDKI